VTSLLHRTDTPTADPGTAEAAPILSVALDGWGASWRLTLCGELCGASLAALETQVDQLGCLPCAHLVVDLRQVTALDEAGANVILGYYYVLGHGGALEVTASTGPVTDILRLVGGGLLSLTHGSVG
jgi:anti-anti-sigma regulatory factor